MSEAGKMLSKALDRPSEWEFNKSEFWIRHTPSKTTWWVASGGSFFDGYEQTPKCLGLIERHFLYSKYKRAANQRVAQLLSASVNH